MAFFGNLVKSFLTTEKPHPNTVLEVDVSSYTRLSIIARESCFILYGPNTSSEYELLLNIPVETTKTKAYSLFRDNDVNSAQLRFISTQEILLPLMQIKTLNILDVATMQLLCNLIRNHPSWTCAHVAAYMNYTSAFSNQSVNKYIDTIDLEEKKSPLHIAVERKNVGTIRILMEKNVSVDVVDTEGNSVFHLAAKTDEVIVQMIASRNSKLINCKNGDEKTPLHIACESDKPKCVKALICAGADVNVAATHDSTLPIHMASSSNSTLCAKEIIALYPNQLNAEDMKYGGTPLHWATSKEMIIALVELGCLIDAKNFQGSTALHKMVQHDNLKCVLALLSFEANVDIQDNDGCTPLHFVQSTQVLKALLVFRAKLDMLNNKGETPRHIISTSTGYFDNNGTNQKDSMLYTIHAVGAQRCSSHMSTCQMGCMPEGSFDGIPPDTYPKSRERHSYDELLDQSFFDQAFESLSQQNGLPVKSGRVLCLDGGGIKGLILIQLLIGLEEATGKSIIEMFDWISGTSTGSILAFSLVLGKKTRYAQGLYFRLKDEVFVGQRPYDAAPFEKILKKEFGHDTKMSEIKGKKVVVAGVLADRFPADLHLFRNYESGQEILNENRGSQYIPTLPPDKQNIWEAARSSGAAPSYFSSYERFIDGGLIGNNPTLDILTEIMEYNTTMMMTGHPNQIEQPKLILSLGCGRSPVVPVNDIDIFKPDGIFKTIKIAYGLSNMVKLLIDQATMADNRTVDRARAWCGMSGIAYVRLSPQLSEDVQLDETKDDVLVNMLWETMVYIKMKKLTIEKLAKLLS